MPHLRHATTKLTRYVSTTGTTLWTRMTAALSRAFSSHAAWSARAWTATSDLHDDSSR